VDLVEDAAFTLVRGRRYALVGRNGKGKSTLLQAVAARRVGSVPEACAVHYVHQDIQLSSEQEELRPVDLVLAADVERRVLLNDRDVINSKLKDASPSEASTLTKDLQKVLERLETCEADSAARRADELLQNLGFSEALRKRKMRELSGGWRVRTFLASALFARPDVLLLDEPTNHLSIAAVLWLARELTTSEVWADRVVVCVSHDRTFLEDVCGDVLHISGHCRRLTQTHGDYATWRARRAEKLITWQRQQKKQEAEVEKLKEYAGHGFRYGGSQSQINKMKMKARQADKVRDSAWKGASIWHVRHRRASPPSDEVVGGLFFDFEPLRTASGPSARRGGERERGRGDGVLMRPRRRDAVAVITRESPGRCATASFPRRSRNASTRRPTKRKIY
jgi:ATP-binding cassette subfamily F protein 3